MDADHDSLNGANDNYLCRVLYYLDGKLSDEDVAALESELRDDGPKQRQFVETCLQIKLIQESLSDGLREFDDGQEDTEVVNPVQTKPRDKQEVVGRSRTRRRFPLRLVVQVAGIVLLVSWGWWASSRPVATVPEVDGHTFLERDGHSIVLRAGESLRGGDVLKTDKGGALSVRYTDGTSLRLHERTRATFDMGRQRGKLLEIHSGHVSADIVAQPAAKPMRFRSENAEATVVGTQLDFVVNDATTILRVTAGKVKFAGAETDKELLIESDQIALATPGNLTVDRGKWPTNHEGLVFLFRTNQHPNVVFTSTDTPWSYTLKAHRQAEFDKSGAMDVSRGAFEALKAGAIVQDECQQTNELTIEALVRPAQAQQTGPARIVTLSRHSQELNFTLGQQQKKLVLRLATDEPAAGKLWSDWSVCDLVANRWQHIAVTYGSGEVTCYRDGKRVFRSQASGSFRNWKSLPLLLGDDESGDRNWSGQLQGVAIYNRCLSAGEVRNNARRYPKLLQTVDGQVFICYRRHSNEATR